MSSIKILKALEVVDKYDLDIEQVKKYIHIGSDIIDGFIKNNESDIPSGAFDCTTNNVYDAFHNSGMKRECGNCPFQSSYMINDIFIYPTERLSCFKIKVERELSHVFGRSDLQNWTKEMNEKCIKELQKYVDILMVLKDEKY